MYKPISKNLHGKIDYTYAAFVPLLPVIAGFKGNTAARVICRTLGAGALAYTLLTNANWAPIRILPFKAHLIIDLSVSLLALATPWLFGFNKTTSARNTLIAVGFAGLTASVLTNPEEPVRDRILSKTTDTNNKR